MSKTTQAKATTINVQLPQSAYPKIMYFNRVQVERDDGFTLVHFGLVSKGVLQLDSYTCVFSELALEQNRQSLVEYLGRTGPAKASDAKKWQMPRTGSSATNVADIINVAVRGGIAETCLSVFSMTAATRAAREHSADSVEAQPLALLRSELDTQLQFIEALYET